MGALEALLGITIAFAQNRTTKKDIGHIVFFEKVDYRGRYSSIFKMGTALGKRGVATSILRPHSCHHYHFGAETW